MSVRSLIGRGVALWLRDGGSDGSAVAHDVRLRGRRGAGGVLRFARASVVSCAVFAGLAGVSTPVSAALWANASSMIVRGSNGLPITVRIPEALASVSGGAAGTGGAVARASVPVVVGGVTTALELSKPVSVANVARVARVAARLSGPLALAGLVYDGVQWVNDEWVSTDPQPDGSGLGIQWTGNNSASYPGSGPMDACNNYVKAAYNNPSAFCTRVGGDDKPNVLTSACQAPNRCSDGYFDWHNGSGGYYGFSQSVYYQLTPCNSGAVRDPDTGVCMIESDAPATDAQLEISFQQGLIASPTAAASVLDTAVGAAPSAVSEFGSEPVVVSGPATVDGGTRSSSTVGPNGTVTTTVQTTYNFDYSGDTVNITETQVTTVTDVNGSTVTTTTTQVPPSAEPVSPSEPAEDVECGLPGMPPCKIDETGTPTGEDVRSEGEAAIQEGYDAIEGGISGLGDAPVDDLGWSWSFEFPSASCSALVINFRSYSRVVDWCPILGQMRDIWGWAVGVMGALFVWRRATSPM